MNNQTRRTYGTLVWSRGIKAKHNAHVQKVLLYIPTVHVRVHYKPSNQIYMIWSINVRMTGFLYIFKMQIPTTELPGKKQMNGFSPVCSVM